VDFRVLTCDRMKQRRGWSPKSYWPDVAAAGATHRGDGSSTLVVADRNLVLLPKANLSSVARTLNSDGGRPAQCLFCCSWASRGLAICSITTRPSLYAGSAAPRLPASVH
jgi:hypothetical protein